MKKYLSVICFIGLLFGQDKYQFFLESDENLKLVGDNNDNKSMLKNQYLTEPTFSAEEVAFREINKEHNKNSINRISNNYPKAYRSLDRETFFATLVDSSKNGYGYYLSQTNPITYNPDYGFSMIYRKWQGMEESSGYIGVAQSLAGDNWFTSYPINENLPDGTPMSTGRYPSIVMGSDGTNFAVWNEFTTDCSGGGNTCGRIFFNFNQITWYQDYPNDDMIDLNNGCATNPCYPEDLWQVQPQLIETDDFWNLYTVSNSWSAGTNYFIKTTIQKSTGDYSNTDPLALNVLDNDYNIFKMNTNGEGVITNLTSSNVVEYLITNDFGTTWENKTIPEDLLDLEFANAGYDQEQRDFFWNHESHLDSDGGLHIFVGVSFLYDDTTTASYFHLYNAIPSNQDSWVINHITDITESYNYSFTDPSGSIFVESGMHLFPSVSFSSSGNNVIWFLYNKISGYDPTGFADVDIYLSKSENFGSSWTNLGNLTNTSDGYQLESYIHAIPSSTDSFVGFMYGIPDFDILTLESPTTYADYKQFVYFGFYGDQITENEVPPSVEIDDSDFQEIGPGDYGILILEDEPSYAQILISSFGLTEPVVLAFTDTLDLVASISYDNNIYTLVLQPEPNWNGYANAYVTVSDEFGLDTAEVMIYVEPVNDPPIITQILDQETDEDVPLRIPLEASDVDGDPFFFEVDYVTNDNVSVFVVSNGDSLFMVPYPNWSGEVEINITVDDGFPSGTSSVFNLIVNPVDDDPFVDGYMPDLYFYEDFQEPWSRDLDSVFLDIDDELDLVYSVSFSEGDVIQGEIVDDTLLTLQAYPDGEGEDTMFVTASNPTRASVTDTVLITVFGENDAPVVAEMEPLVMTEDTPYEFMSMASLVEAGHITDVDNTLEELTFHLHSETDHVHVEWDGDASSTPLIHTEPDYYGPGSLTLCAADEYEERCTVIGLNVDPVNDAPYFASEMGAPVGVDMEFHLPLDVMDVDSEELVVTLNEEETNPEWVMITNHTLHGTPDILGEYPVHLSLTDGQETTLGTFVLHVINFKPEIVAIEDIPNDQGGNVYVGFHGSFLDNGVETNQLYSVFRWDNMGEESGWVGVQSIAAIGEEYYVYQVPTIMDSTSEIDGMTEFKVVASMNNGIFHSDPMMGYSVDNIAPGVPGGLMAVAMYDNIQLSWDRSTDEDFQYFVLEKATNMDFTEPEVVQTADTSYTDVNFTANETNYYRLTAVDHAGNTSDYSTIVEAAVLSIDENMVPEVFALHQNYPNPFNPVTKLQYDLPEDSYVRVTVYDMLGNVVNNLVNDNQNSGYRSVKWNATNNQGQPVSAGVYLYSIEAGKFRQTKKMILLK